MRAFVCAHPIFVFSALGNENPNLYPIPQLILFFVIFVSMLCLHMVQPKYAVPTEASRGCQIPETGATALNRYVGAKKLNLCLPEECS